MLVVFTFFCFDTVPLNEDFAIEFANWIVLQNSLKNAEVLSVAVKILATLGEGTFGKVVKVKELNS